MQGLTVNHLTILAILLDEGCPLWATEIVDAYERRSGRRPDLSNMMKQIDQLMDRRLLRIRRTARMYRRKTPQYVITDLGVDVLNNVASQILVTQELPRYYEMPEQETDQA